MHQRQAHPVLQAIQHGRKLCNRARCVNMVEGCAPAHPVQALLTWSKAVHQHILCKLFNMGKGFAPGHPGKPRYLQRLLPDSTPMTSRLRPFPGSKTRHKGFHWHFGGKPPETITTACSPRLAHGLRQTRVRAPRPLRRITNRRIPLSILLSCKFQPLQPNKLRHIASCRKSKI